MANCKKLKLILKIKIIAEIFTTIQEKKKQEEKSYFYARKFNCYIKYSSLISTGFTFPYFIIIIFFLIFSLVRGLIIEKDISSSNIKVYITLRERKRKKKGA